MWCNFILIAVVFILAFIGFSGYSLAKNNADKVSTRTELANQLAKLPYDFENNGPPEGAMCYDMAAPIERVDYYCPVCNEMTLYNVMYGDNIDNLYSYRASVERIKKIDVKLDESEFCKKCSPNVKEPKYCLIVTYGKDAKPHKTCDITSNDMDLLYDFSEGKKEHYNCPIKNYKERLEELLGTKIKDFGK
jgi:hypothetical protein